MRTSDAQGKLGDFGTDSEAEVDSTSSCLVDGKVPRQILQPRSLNGVSEALSGADRDGTAVIPWGGGTHMALGNRPSRYDLALRMTGLSKLVEYVPADMTITVESGITIGALQALLADQKQFLPIDAPATATIGGVLAAGASGPSRHMYGLPRDWLIGCKLALADGTIVKGGGRVVKNVAGYDVPKLVVGALGTLGVTVEATFKLAPLPHLEQTLLARFASNSDALLSIFKADERRLAMWSVAVEVSRTSGATAAFRVGGRERVVTRTLRELEDVAGAGVLGVTTVEDRESSRWWAERVRPLRCVLGRASLWLTTQPSKVAVILDALSTDPRTMYLAYPTTGRIEVEAPADVAFIKRIRDALTSAGGTAVIAAAPPDLKGELGVWDDDSTPLPLMKRLKAEFDPRGTLCPGRFVGGI